MYSKGIAPSKPWGPGRGRSWGDRSEVPERSGKESRGGMSVAHVFLPVYNEQEAIARQVKEVHAMLKCRPVSFHLLVVDDGSTDDTPGILEDLQRIYPDTLTVLTHDRNRGIDGVFRTGLFHVASIADPADRLIVMEADRTNDLDSLPAMLEALEGGSALVIASRFVPGGEIRGFPVNRRLATWGVNRLLGAVFRVNGATDYTIFYRGYSVRLLQDAVRKYGDRLIETSGFVANAEILAKLKPLGPLVREVPMVYRYDLKKSSSKLKVAYTIRQYLKLMGVHLLARGAVR